MGLAATFLEVRAPRSNDISAPKAILTMAEVSYQHYQPHEPGAAELSKPGVNCTWNYQCFISCPLFALTN
jgi:hypothetical protein